MTETLARVYLEQKKYQKAIQAYEILILKYPEKSSFFADRISDIRFYKIIITIKQ
jgi:virulence-associated protein VapD